MDNSTKEDLENLLKILVIFAQVMVAIAPVIKCQMRDMVVKIRDDFTKLPKEEIQHYFINNENQRKEDCKDFVEIKKPKIDRNEFVQLPTWMIFWKDQLKKYLHIYDYEYKEKIVLKKLLFTLCEDSKANNDQSKSNFNFVNWGKIFETDYPLNDETIFQITSVFYNKVHTYKDKPKTLQSLDSKCILEFGLNHYSMDCPINKRDLNYLKDLRNQLCHVSPSGVIQKEYRKMLKKLKNILKRLDHENTTDAQQLIYYFESNERDVKPKRVGTENSAPGASAGFPEKCFGISDILSDRLGRSEFRDLNKVVAIVMKKAKKEHLEKIIPNC